MQKNQSSPTPAEAELVRSIRQTAKDQIRLLEAEFEQTGKNLRQQYQQDIQQIQEKEEKNTAARIKQEINRAVNRSLIEKKKLHLNVLESFSETMISDTVSELHGSAWPRLRQFFVRTALETLQSIHSSHVSITIYGPPEKRQQLRDDLVKNRKSTAPLAITLQDRNSDTGLTIKDPENRCTHNLSISRICRRKKEQLRKIIFQEISRNHKRI